MYDLKYIHLIQTIRYNNKRLKTKRNIKNKTNRKTSENNVDHSKPLQTARSSWRNHQVPAYFIKYVVTKLHKPTQIHSLSPLSNGPFKQSPIPRFTSWTRIRNMPFWKDKQDSVSFINATTLWQSYTTMPKFISLALPPCNDTFQASPPFTSSTRICISLDNTI